MGSEIYKYIFVYFHKLYFLWEYSKLIIQKLRAVEMQKIGVHEYWYKIAYNQIYHLVSCLWIFGMFTDCKILSICTFENFESENC